MKKKMVALVVLMLLFSVFLVKTEAKGSNDKDHVQVGIERQEVKARNSQDRAQVGIERQEAKVSNPKENTQVKVDQKEAKEVKPKEPAQVNTEKQEAKEVKPKEQPQVNTEKQEVKENNLKDYIEVDIERQEISMYVGGKLVVKGPVVTGNVEAGRDTPEGEFSILEKDYDVVLVGPDYESHVTYWMQIYGGIGIHDADGWRDEYGGDIYLSDGSHGCINVPLEIVEVIYENAYVGMTVIVK